ncbi:hypothetical protein BDZ97DRAFT_1914928 [Flammula alnicola]|nr:hypothetical protein BDZ97DRAFT_1914928 [Flammula alnicola]
MPGLLNQSYDDRNDNVFNYQGSWFLNQGVWNASSVGQSGTLASTSDTNANVTFVFPTPAIAFYYYGIPRSRGGSYGICVDCDPNNRIFIPVDGFNATDDGKNPPIVLFSQTFTQPGVHEVIMRNQPDARGTPPGNSELTLDRIDLEVVDNSAGPATVTVSPSGQPTNSLTANPASSKSLPPIGAIVGAVLGGLAVLVGIIILLYWLRLRRKYAARAKENALPPISSTTYPGPGGGEGPFVRPYLYSSAATASHPDMQQTATGTPSTASSPPPSGRPGGYGYGMGKTIPSRTHQRQMASSTSQATSQVTTLSTSPPSSSGATTQRTPTQPGPRRELDGGPCRWMTLMSSERRRCRRIMHKFSPRRGSRIDLDGCLCIGAAGG